MKKKKKLFIIIPLIITVLILSIVGIYYAVIGIRAEIYYEVYKGLTVTHSDIKSIDLSDLSEIKITNNNETVTLDADNDKYKIICDAFNQQEVKIDDSRVYFWNENEYKIQFNTDDQKYILYGYPEKNNGEELNDPVVFVLYDYTNKYTMEYLYQIVTTSKDEFLEIFPDFE